MSLLVVSSSVAFLLTDNKVSFAKAFIATTIAQILLYRLYVWINELWIEKILNERISEFSKQGCEVTCPCDRAIKHFIPITLDTDNSYKCMDCNKNVAVNVDVKTFIETAPINIEKTNAAFNVIYNQATDDNGTDI